MLSDEEIRVFREKLRDSSRPLFLFDDDADGVTSFVLMYKMVGDGKGICVKGKPVVESVYARKVDEFCPDRVFVLDKPMIEQEFLDEVSQEVVWLDHHPLQNNKGVVYFNPRKHDSEDNTPTSFWAYQICKEDVPEALWIAGIGVVGDWSMALKDELSKKYPDLLPESVSSAPEALFNTKLGELVKILDFNLKGTTTQVMQAVKVFSRIQNPYEILDQLTPKGKFLYKNYMKLKEKYDSLKNSIEITKNPIIFFKYSDSKLAISSMLSNELLFEHPDKIIMIAREKKDELMVSIRSSEVNIEKVLSKSLEGVEGYGGGHDNACGACIKKKDFETFLSNFEDNINKVLKK